jgi:very-short-patch-repair endonuclease
MAALIARVAAGAESYLEVHGMEEVFVGRRFRNVLRQHVVSTRGGRHWLDMYDAASMTAIELDGATYHAGVKDWQRDLRRDADLAAVGILTLRFSYRDLTERPQWCRAAALDVLRLRSVPVRDAPARAVERAGEVRIEPLNARSKP